MATNLSAAITEEERQELLDELQGYRPMIAANAMQGILAAHADPETVLPKANWLASKSLEYADALIAELSKS